MKIESFLDPSIQEKMDDKLLSEKVSELLAMLSDFPNSYVHLSKDGKLSEKIDEIKTELDISPLEERIEKKILIEKLSSLLGKETIDYKKDNNFLDPSRSVLNLFDLVSKKQEAKKKEHFEKLQGINEELAKINQLIGIVHVQSKEGRVDLSKMEDATKLIDEITAKYGMVDQKTPYVFENRNDLIAYLNQKAKEISNKTSEEMMFLQQGVDQLKSFVDITREIVKQDSETKKHILSKS
jgi:hypothetical protein